MAQELDLPVSDWGNYDAAGFIASKGHQKASDDPEGIGDVTLEKRGGVGKLCIRVDIPSATQAEVDSFKGA